MITLVSQAEAMSETADLLENAAVALEGSITRIHSNGALLRTEEALLEDLEYARAVVNDEVDRLRDLARDLRYQQDCDDTHRMQLRVLSESRRRVLEGFAAHPGGRHQPQHTVPSDFDP